MPLWLRLAGPASTAELCCSKLHLANYCKNASIDNNLAACCHSHAGASVPTGYRRKVQCIQTAVNSPHTIDTNDNPQSTHPVSLCLHAPHMHFICRSAVRHLCTRTVASPATVPACCPFPQRLRLPGHGCPRTSGNNNDDRLPDPAAVQLLILLSQRRPRPLFAFGPIAVGSSCSRKHHRSQTRCWPLTAAGRLPGTPAADMGFPAHEHAPETQSCQAHPRARGGSSDCPAERAVIWRLRPRSMNPACDIPIIRPDIACSMRL